MRRLVTWALLLTGTGSTMPAWTQACDPERLKTIWTTCVDKEATGYNRVPRVRLRSLRRE